MSREQLVGVALVSLALTIWTIIANKNEIKSGKVFGVALVFFLFIYAIISLLVVGIGMIMRG